MSWFYSPDGKERVEVPDALFESLISDRIIKAEALVWKEGMADWRAASDVMPEALLLTKRARQKTGPKVSRPQEAARLSLAPPG